jgi:hypothetical protein
MNTEAKVYDSTPAHSLEIGDQIKVWDEINDRFDITAVLTMDDLGDTIRITVDLLEEPLYLEADKDVDLYSYSEYV